MVHTAVEIKASQEADEVAFLNAASANPDVSNKGGIPDRISGASTVRNQKNNEMIANNVTSGNWDALVVVWNFLSRKNLSKMYKDVFTAGGVRVKSVVEQAFWPDGSIAELTTGGICVYIMESGKSPFYDPDNPTAWDKPLDTIQIHPDDDMTTGQMRVVGQNVKLTPTSPEVLFSGLLTQGATPSYASLNKYHLGLTEVEGIVKPYYFPIYCRDFVMPPSGTNNLLKTVGATQRSAWDGAFQPSIMDFHNAIPEIQNQFGNWYHGPLKGNLPRYHLNTITPLPLNQFDLREFNTQQIQQTTNEMNYVYITGLTAGQTFQCTSSYTIEQYPDSSDSLLLAYAQQSPTNNEDAITRYDISAREIEQFYPASANAHGDYARAFNNMLRKVTTVVAVTGIPGIPGSQMLAGGLLASGVLRKRQGAKALNSARVDKRVANVRVNTPQPSSAQAARPRTVPAAKAPGNQKGTPKQQAKK